jgi:hypothetical protein
VTVADYLACVSAGACTQDSTLIVANSGCNDGVAGRENHPENCVNPDHAIQYCAWKGARLPTPIEWEYAARWGHGGDYPWGSGKPTGPVCFSQDAGSTCPAGGSPGDVNPLGILDLAGNVREWTAGYEMRGGSYSSPVLELLRSPVRYAPSSGTAVYPFAGFRCAAGLGGGGPTSFIPGAPVGPRSCRAYESAQAPFQVACNANTVDGYYWAIGAEVKEYGYNSLGGCGSPRCDATTVGTVKQTASWQFAASWWEVSDTYVQGGPGAACPATDGTAPFFSCPAAHCGAYEAVCTAQVAP